MDLSRRRFLYIVFGSIFLVIFSKNYNQGKLLIYDKELKKNIIKFNSSRSEKLKKIFNDEKNKDLINGRTIWIDKKLYTYAELYNEKI